MKITVYIFLIVVLFHHEICMADRLLTFNAGLAKNYVAEYEIRRKIMAEQIRTVDADIICLQEVWIKKDVIMLIQQLGSKFNHSYYKHFNTIIPLAKSNGLLILSKYPLVERKYIPYESFLFKRGALVATALVDKKPFRIACTHLTAMIYYIPYFGNFGDEETEQTRQIQTLFAAEPNLDIILGDFNSGPAQPPHIKAFAPAPYFLILKKGYTSPITSLKPIPCTWCDRNTLAEEGYGELVIDHIFLKEHLKWNSTDLVLSNRLLIDGTTTYLSDHFGVTVDLDWPDKSRSKLPGE